MNPDIEATKKDIDTYGALAALHNTAPGQTLIDTLTKDVGASIDVIISQYAIIPEIELRTAAATLAIKLTLLRAINRAPQNYADAAEYLKTLTA